MSEDNVEQRTEAAGNTLAGALSWPAYPCCILSVCVSLLNQAFAW